MSQAKPDYFNDELFIPASENPPLFILQNQADGCLMVVEYAPYPRYIGTGAIFMVWFLLQSGLGVQWEEVLGPLRFALLALVVFCCIAILWPTRNKISFYKDRLVFSGFRHKRILPFRDIFKVECSSFDKQYGYGKYTTRIEPTWRCSIFYTPRYAIAFQSSDYYQLQEKLTYWMEHMQSPDSD